MRLNLEPFDVIIKLYGSKIRSKPRASSKTAAFRCTAARRRSLNVSDVLVFLDFFLPRDATALYATAILSVCMSVTLVARRQNR